MILDSDFMELTDNNPDLEILRNKTIMITGATGMLARYLTEFFLYLNRLHFHLHLILIVRNEQKARRLFHGKLNDQVELLVSDLTTPLFCNKKVDLLIHAASLADPQYYRRKPVDVLLPNTLGTYYCLELARRVGTEQVLFFSSAEIYGSLNGEGPICENISGSLDPLDLRSCYSESKRMGETLCAAYARQYGIRTLCLRIFHTYGPTMNLEQDQRVFSEFLRTILESNQIVMKSSGQAKRAFCYALDMVSACLAVINRGQSAEAYNLANDEAFVSIRELAETLIRTFPERRIQLIEAERDGLSDYVENQTTTYRTVSTAKLRTLGWYPRISLEEGFRRTLHFLQQQQKKPTAGQS